MRFLILILVLFIATPASADFWQYFRSGDPIRDATYSPATGQYDVSFAFPAVIDLDYSVSDAWDLEVVLTYEAYDDDSNSWVPWINVNKIDREECQCGWYEWNRRQMAFIKNIRLVRDVQIWIQRRDEPMVSNDDGSVSNLKARF